jgi:aminodeoxyfutalosine deaminase
VHLEGAMRPATVLDLARQNGVAVPGGVAAGLQNGFTFTSFEQFIQTYISVTRCLRRAADYERIVVELAEDLARQGVSYAEVTCSPSTPVLYLGLSESDFVDGLTRGRNRARVEHGVELTWVFDIVARSVDPARYYAFTTSIAIEQRHNGVVALGLVGAGIDVPTGTFLPYVRRAKAAGLHITPHAGEVAGPAQVWEALDVLGADRIGHGVRSIEDPALVKELARRRICLEVCPTSNVRLGLCPSHADHPMHLLYEAGVPVTVNSDDPGLFGSTLSQETALLTARLGFAEAEAAEVLENAVRYSFRAEATGG